MWVSQCNQLLRVPRHQALEGFQLRFHLGRGPNRHTEALQAGGRLHSTKAEALYVTSPAGENQGRLGQVRVGVSGLWCHAW